MKFYILKYSSKVIGLNMQKKNQLGAPTVRLLYSQRANPQNIPSFHSRNAILLRCIYSESVKGATSETSN